MPRINYSALKSIFVGSAGMEQEMAQYFANKLRPRALILMANQKDLEKIKDFIKTLSEVKLVYVTTAPCSTALRVIKEPNDKQPFEQPLFTLETGS